MERLTDRRTAEAVRENIEGLIAADVVQRGRRCARHGTADAAPHGREGYRRDHR